MNTHIKDLGHPTNNLYMGGHFGPEDDHPYKGPWPPDQSSLYGWSFQAEADHPGSFPKKKHKAI